MPNLPLAEGFTLCLALVLLTVSYLIRGPPRWLRRDPRRPWPADEIATNRPTRGPAWPLRWTFVLLILAMSLTVSYAWALQTLLPATMQPPAVAVIVPTQPTRAPVPIAVVCSRDATLFRNITSPSGLLTREAQLAGVAAASKSPALSAFGTSLTEGLRTKDPDRITERALHAIQLYCARVTAPIAHI